MSILTGRAGGLALIYHVHCEVCSHYSITEHFFLHLRSMGSAADITSGLSAVVRRHLDHTGRAETVTTENYKKLASLAPDKNDVRSKLRYLLAYIARKSTHPGEQVTLQGQTDYPICFAANVGEFGFYAQYAKDAGFVDGTLDSGGCHSFLTPKGWEEVERVPTLESPNAFVAMSFSRRGEYADLLKDAWDKAIQPAIETDGGFHAIRVDKEHFLGDIVFEIIARINESRFVVADVTEHKNGVYFEAGYAMGMGLPVIWMCHREDMANAHFDTSHLNHIVWEDLGELRKNLANRIVANIGRGPKATENRP